MNKKRTRNSFEERIKKSLKKSKVKFSYETERIPYTIEGNYVPDFIIDSLDGKIYLETKGHFRPFDKRKMVAVKKANPDLDIRFLFYSHKLSNERWCKKYGFPYAVENIPKDWLS